MNKWVILGILLTFKLAVDVVVIVVVNWVMK